MRSRGPGMNMLRCDVPGCESRFYSASVLPMIRTQAVLAGWARISANKVNVGGEPLGSYRQRVDICPSCQPAPVMDAAPAGAAA